MTVKASCTILLCLAVVACDNLGLSGEPEQMDVEVDGVGTSEITLVTSTNWILTTDPACNPEEQVCPQVLRVLDADTSIFDVPLRRTFRFTREFKYYVEVFPAGGQTATLRMKIHIDGQSWYDESRELRPVGEDGEQETLQFVYQWRQPTL